MLLNYWTMSFGSSLPWEWIGVFTIRVLAMGLMEVLAMRTVAI